MNDPVLVIGAEDGAYGRALELLLRDRPELAVVVLAAIPQPDPRPVISESISFPAITWPQPKPFYQNHQPYLRRKKGRG